MAALNEIVNFKVSKGFSDNPQNVVLASSNEVTGYGMGAGFAAMANKRYYLSFENNGILFINVNWVTKLTGECSLLPLSEIKSLYFEREKMRAFASNGNSSPLNSVALMIEGNDDSIMHLSVIRYVIGQTWLKDNLNYVRRMLQS